MSDRAATLDPGALEQLREIGGDDFLAELIETFLDEAPTLLEQLRRAVERGDAGEARRAAHTLKSNGATFGAETFAELCRQLEQQATSGDLTGGEELRVEIDADYVRLEEALAALRDRASS